MKDIQEVMFRISPTLTLSAYNPLDPCNSKLNMIVISVYCCFTVSTIFIQNSQQTLRRVSSTELLYYVTHSHFMESMHKCTNSHTQHILIFADHTIIQPMTSHCFIMKYTMINEFSYCRCNSRRKFKDMQCRSATRQHTQMEHHHTTCGQSLFAI